MRGGSFAKTAGGPPGTNSACVSRELTGLYSFCQAGIGAFAGPSKVRIRDILRSSHSGHIRPDRNSTRNDSSPPPAASARAYTKSVDNPYYKYVISDL